MKPNSSFSVTSLASNGDAFANLLESATTYFDVFDGKDFWVPAKKSPLHGVLVDYVCLDAAARAFAEKHFEWDDSELNEYWTFYPCGFLLDYCDRIEAGCSEFSEEEFVEKLQAFASSSAHNPLEDM